MRRLSWAVILLTLGTASASAQYYMNVFRHNGQQVQYVTEDIDSVTFTGNAIRDDGFHNGYEYVDLGLSVKWATCNVGAANPEDFGDYYSWGETEKKSFYNWSSYKFRSSGDSYDNVTFSKYNTNDKRGTVDNKTILELGDDVARVKWGGGWRIPTEAEIDELKKRCSWTWTTLNGVKGYRVTSNVSGYTDRSIFLPAAGFRDGMRTKKNGTYGQYWSSSLYTFDTFLARHLIFGSSDVHANDYYRYNGQSVRPVCPSDGWLSHLTVSMNHDFIFLIKGDSSLLSVDVKYDEDDYSYSNFLSWQWNSDNPSVVTVNDDGAIMAVSYGTAHISATSGTLSVQSTVKVVNVSENNHQYVDLGLSVNWATCNVGASKPEDYGNYYAWGEVEAKDSYLFENYSFRASGDSYNNAKFSKYNTDDSRGTVDTKLSLDPEDDVAHIKWGGSWRMPTNSELEELITNCTWTWTTLNGVKGYRVTSKIPGYSDNSIFLPVAGCYSGSDIDYAGTYGCYWSSSLFTVDPYSACYLIFGLSNITQTNDNTRHYGQSVRPVCAKTTQDDSNPNSGITSLTLDNTNLTLIVGEEYSLKATAWNGNEEVDTATITWKSDNESVATVSIDGLVKALSVGSATITASCEGKSATCSVSVDDGTIGENGFHNGFEFVDLGLSVKWATYNVGATKPEEFGDYYAWGEIEQKDKYSWSNYKWCNGSYSTLTKYNTDGEYGVVDNKTTLDPDDDVAHVKWGGDWRIPTKEELDELSNNCTCIITTENGVRGFRVTSTKSGYTDRSIFIPAAGYRLDKDLNHVGSASYLWSSLYDQDATIGGYYLYLYPESRGTASLSRCLGHSVRPVCPKDTPNDPTPTNIITSVTLDTTSLSLKVTGKYTLKATAWSEYEEVDTATITWKSDNESVATVSIDGLVRAKSVGTATVTATCGDKAASCTITVTPFVPEYVDLGLSVKWATFNVGATKIDEIGDYYAWGETELKTDFGWTSYKFRISGESQQDIMFSKYVTDSDYGTVDNKTTLDLEDDVARVMWGGNWRMPTRQEWSELLKNCSLKWVRTANSEFGVSGWKLTSKVEGYTDRYIFLPASESTTNYWSSSLGQNDAIHATGFLFMSGMDMYMSHDFYRINGILVRPVCLLGTQNDPTPTNIITSVTLDTTSLSLKVDEEYSLKATVLSGNVEVDTATITWRSDNESVATVSTDGLVKAIAVGNATITASSGDVSVTCSVTVVPIFNQNEVSYGNVTLYKAKADSTDVTSFNIEARLKGLSTLEEGSYAVYFYYSDTSYTPSASNNAIRVKANLKGDSIASYALNGMDMCSTYYFRVAVATFEGDIYYGPVDGYVVKDLVTKGDKIDLGIPGIKFASCNLGATQPGQSGDRYAWGETQSKTSFSLGNYSYYNENVDIWKGLGDDISGTQYDAATAVLGEGWHMPNSEVMSKLSMCIIKSITYNGINGYLVIGPNSNAIFLPSGAYWTSSYSSDNEQRAKIWNSGIEESYRYSGCMIRPIFGQIEYPMEYVDLGLSVKWATCNVGAVMPQDYGNYYGSGEAVLPTEDDVAHEIWGGSWRLPTWAELYEIQKYCTWKWYGSGNSEFNGVAGYKVTSNVSGYTNRSIFLPAAGYRNDASLSDVAHFGKYWSSTCNRTSPQLVEYLNFDDGTHSISDVLTEFNYGFSVRPVCPSDEWLSSLSISFDEDNKTILVGNHYCQKVSIKHKDEVVNFLDVTWSSDNPMVAIVGETGIVLAESVGTAHITASIDSLSAQYTVSVIDDESKIEHEYVDLGLSVKWATFNVGATKPEEYGDYYAWGEPETKSNYDYSTYKWCNGSYNTLTKYCNNSNYGNEGFTDTLKVLTLEDDVAHVKWGGSWRMPTKAEQDELRNSCTWTWTTLNGVNGYRVTSNKEGYTDRSIFLPAAGCRYDTELYSVGGYGYYWSSSLYADLPYYAWDFDVASSNVGTLSGNRNGGFSVRPVLP